MRLLRSMAMCALALVASAIVMTVPASAAVPVEPGLSASFETVKAIPGHVDLALIADNAIKTDDAPTIAGSKGADIGRSTVSTASFHCSNTGPATFMHIDPDIRC